MNGDAQPAGQAKEKSSPETKAAPKQGPDGSDMNTPKSQGKGDGDAKQNPMEGPKQASAKDGGDKSDQKDAAKSKPEGGAEDKTPPDQTNPKDAADLAKKLQDDLKSQDPERRQRAEDFIRRYLAQSPDPKTRDAANKALQDAGLQPGDGPVAADKPKDPPDAPPDAPKTPPAQGKSGSDQDATPQTKNNPPQTPNKDEKPGESKGDGQPPKGADTTKQQPPTPPGTPRNRPGAGQPGPVNDGQPDKPDEPRKPETPLTQPKTLLQLYNFWQRVPKDVLKDVEADPAQRRLLEQAAVEDKDNLADPLHGGPLNATAGKTSNPKDQTANDDPNNGGRALPPPGYREPYKDFTKLLSPGGDNK